MITQIDTSTCSTDYTVQIDRKLDTGEIVTENVNLQLWIITGGEPALDFSTYGYTKRFPVVERWSHGNEVGTGVNCIGHVTGFTHYKHQGTPDKRKHQGPTFAELPNGEQDIYDFIRDNLDKKKLQEKRIAELAELHGDTIKSNRKHDKDNSTHVYAKLKVNGHFISPVTFDAGCYCGRCDEVIVLFPAWWKKAQELFNKQSGKHWHEITEADYQILKQHLEAYKGE